MNRQEILLNLTLITVIGALGYSIYDAHNHTTAAAEVADVRSNPDEEDSGTKPETTYNRVEAGKKFPKMGETELFRAIIPPTPTPVPPTPKPTDTPNIQIALNAWKVLSVDKGIVTIEDVVKSRTGADDSVFDMKVGDTRPIDIGGGQTRPAKLESVDEITNPDVPTATFGMQDTQAQRTLKMGDEAGDSPIAKGAEPGAGATPAPGPAPQ